MDPVLSFDFNSNAQWNEYFSKVEFPSKSEPTMGTILKLKRKWYKNNIDPNYEIPSSTSATTSATTSTSTSSESNTSATTSATTNTGSSSNSTSSQSSSSSLNTIEFFKRNKVAILGWAANGLCLLNVATTFLPLYDSMADSYYKVFKRALAAYILAFYNKHGMVQFNKQYWTSALRDDNSAYILYCLFFFIQPSMVVPAVFPIAVFALFGFASYTPTVLKAVLPQSAKTIILPQVQRVNNSLINIIQPATQAVAALECTNTLFIFYYNGLLNGLLYLNFLKLRYYQSPSTRLYIINLKATINMLTAHRYCPRIIGTIWTKFVQIAERY